MAPTTLTLVQDLPDLSSEKGHLDSETLAQLTSFFTVLQQNRPQPETAKFDEHAAGYMAWMLYGSDEIREWAQRSTTEVA